MKHLLSLPFRLSKKILLGLLFFFNPSLNVHAQRDSDPYSFNKGRHAIQQKGMTVLGSWAIGNIAVGSIMSTQTEGNTKYFHQMNALWNVVNLGLAIPGYLGARKAVANQKVDYKDLKSHFNTEKILLFNAGLDLGYMAGGAYLMERAKRNEKNSDRLKGFGQSLLLQGGFLFAFDLILFSVQAKHRKRHQPILEKLSVHSSPDGVGLRWKL